MSIFARYQSRYEALQEEEMSVQEYLELCKKRQDGLRQRGGAHAHRHRRTRTGRYPARLAALPHLRQQDDEALPAFREFYGMEEVIEHIVSYFRHAAQGLEEKKQILYLLGPVGGGKSSLAERLKYLMEKSALLRHQGFAGARIAARAVQRRRGRADPRGRLRHPAALPLGTIMSPWAVKRLQNSAATSPSSGWSSCGLRCSPRSPSPRPNRGREQPGYLQPGRQDRHPEARDLFPNDPDAYSYSGGLCLANRGILDSSRCSRRPSRCFTPC